MKRIGVAFPGDPNRPGTWSGTPLGLIRGLTAAGVEPIALHIQPPHPLQQLAVNAVAATYLRPAGDVRTAVSRGRAGARSSGALAWLNTRFAPRRVRAAGALDGIVQIGTGYSLPDVAPVVTFEDMTVRQAIVRPYDGWDVLTPRARRARLARQQRAYEQAVACCLTSPWAAESVTRDYGIDAAKVRVVGIGRNHDVAAVERDWSRPRLLFVGMDWERKNGPRVLRAFARLRESFPDARLDVVGRHPETLEAPGVNAHGVLRLGEGADGAALRALFEQATCFVMPSLFEAAGIVFVEAAAAGIPSIGTSEGGAGYLIGDGGLVVNPLDDEQLYAAMRTLGDPARARAMGALAARHATDFTWDRVARRVLDSFDPSRPTSSNETGP